MASDDITIEVLKESATSFVAFRTDTRDELRGVRAGSTRQRAYRRDERAARHHESTDSTSDSASTSSRSTLLDLAEQQRFLVRYTRAISERESRLEPRVSRPRGARREARVEVAEIVHGVVEPFVITGMAWGGGPSDTVQVRLPSVVLAVVLLAPLLASCAHGPPKFDPAARRTCLVLSVGGPRGVAHLGAIAAVRKAGIRIDCVVGNSMGSLVGALYASAPTQDTEALFRRFSEAYVAETQGRRREERRPRRGRRRGRWAPRSAPRSAARTARRRRPRRAPCSARAAASRSAPSRRRGSIAIASCAS